MCNSSRSMFDYVDIILALIIVLFANEQAPLSWPTVFGRDPSLQRGHYCTSIRKIRTHHDQLPSFVRFSRLAILSNMKKSFCFKFPYSVRSPVSSIPVSKDEQTCMREAQYHSAAVPSMATPYTTTPSQLDPGSLHDSSRRGGTSRGVRPPYGSANSLLKQAIANRLKPSPTSDIPRPTTVHENVQSIPTVNTPPTKEKEDDMNKSVLMNPAWYRDEQGRTGYKTKEWERVPNLQKEQVKKGYKEEKTDDSEGIVNKIDEDLIGKDKRRKKEEKNMQELEEALITLTQATHDEERKKKIKEDNKTQKEREKQERKQIKEEKKKHKSRQKEQNKNQKKRKKKIKEDNKTQKEREKQERKQIKEEKKKHKSRQKEEKKKQKIEKRRKNQMPLKQTCEEQLKQDNSNTFDQSKDKKTDASIHSEIERNTFERKTIKKGKKEDKEEDILRLQISSKNRNEEFGVNSSSKRLEQDVDDSQKSQQLIEKVKKNPAKMEAFISLERQLSNDSQTSSIKSINTVKAQSPKFNHNLSSTNILQHNINSPQSSSTEEERMRRSSDGVKQNTLERRRDSSLSESSRLSFVSHKSVTFSDRIQMHEIERHDILSSSGEDDAAIMSDDELSKSNLERRRRLIRILQSQKNEKNQLINNAEILHMMSPLYSEEEDYKKQENNFFLKQHINQQGTNKSLNLSARFPEYALDSTRNDMDSLSQSSYYPEDQIGPDRFLVEEEDTYISLDQLPLSVRKAINAEVKEQFQGREMLRDQNEIAMGSMSKLHFEETRQSSLLPYPSLPRSASGYFEDQYNHQNMRNSYQQAMYSENVFHNSDSFVPTIREDLVYKQQKELQESFYDNVKIKLPSRTNSLTDEHFKFRESNTAKSHTNSISVAEFQESGKNSQDSLEETPVPSPPRKSSSTSIDRTAFFENINDRKREEISSTPTPSPPRVIITQRPAYSQRVLVTSTTTSTAPKRTELMENQESDNNEEVMRRKFVARFGSGRRAPIAEDDPSDPVHSLGSMESVLSTDSRESVISAASIKAEANIRRNFNY